jgi:hypothetical protein
MTIVGVQFGSVKYINTVVQTALQLHFGLVLGIKHCLTHASTTELYPGPEPIDLLYPEGCFLRRGLNNSSVQLLGRETSQTQM